MTLCNRREVRYVGYYFINNMIGKQFIFVFLDALYRIHFFLISLLLLLVRELAV